MIQLTEIEARALGALVEKSLTTPDLYPLTLNSLLNACNQKSSREPVMNLNEEAVRLELFSLLSKGLAERVHEAGSRVPKFKHSMENLVGSADPKLVGTVCVLLLRGPQTPGELKSRTDRLCVFASTAEVESLLQDLCARPEPFVAKLPRQPGQKESRYRHLFCSSDVPAPAAVEPEAPPPDRLSLLEQRVAKLEGELKALSDRLGKPA
jgi:hypothetical protein